MAHNFLVIDFDYFFPNPMLADNTDLADVMLYDWGSAETHTGDQLYPDFIWETRAKGFVYNNRDLPICTGYERFWDRFTLTPDARIYAADSNLHSAHIFPDPDNIWDRIDLYDAHHDAGYKGGNNTDLHCGNWMLHHHNLGTTNLNVHYPAWRGTVDGSPEGTPIAPVNREIDPGGPVDTIYNMVFVCRSGAWVPSWCDHQFTEFLIDAPRTIGYIGPRPQHREFNLARVHDTADARRQFINNQLTERTTT